MCIAFLCLRSNKNLSLSWRDGNVKPSKGNKPIQTDIKLFFQLKVRGEFYYETKGPWPRKQSETTTIFKLNVSVSYASACAPTEMRSLNK